MELYNGAMAKRIRGQKSDGEIWVNPFDAYYPYRNLEALTANGQLKHGEGFPYDAEHLCAYFTQTNSVTKEDGSETHQTTHTLWITRLDRQPFRIDQALGVGSDIGPIAAADAFELRITSDADLDLIRHNGDDESRIRDFQHGITKQLMGAALKHVAAKQIT
jgi:hypothetical protein